MADKGSAVSAADSDSCKRQIEGFLAKMDRRCLRPRPCARPPPPRAQLGALPASRRALPARGLDRGGALSLYVPTAASPGKAAIGRRDRCCRFWAGAGGLAGKERAPRLGTYSDKAPGAGLPSGGGAAAAARAPSESACARPGLRVGVRPGERARVARALGARRGPRFRAGRPLARPGRAREASGGAARAAGGSKGGRGRPSGPLAGPRAVEASGSRDGRAPASAAVRVRVYLRCTQTSTGA